MRLHKSYNEVAGQKVQRIEALSDGVFAIALTLLVLDIKVPVNEAIHTEMELWAAFLKLGPRLLTWFLSFMTLGIFWTGHSTQFSYIARSDRHLNWISLFFMLFVSVLPFTTAFLGTYIAFKTAIGLYWLNLFVMGVMLYIHWQYAVSHHLTVFTNEQEQKAVDKAIRKRIIVAQSLYGLSALLCVISPYLSIGSIILIQLNYAFALLFGTRKKQAHRTPEE